MDLDETQLRLQSEPDRLPACPGAQGPILQPPDFEARVPDLIRLNHYEVCGIICPIIWNSLQKIRNLDPAVEVAMLSRKKRDRSIPFACAILASYAAFWGRG